MYWESLTDQDSPKLENVQTLRVPTKCLQCWQMQTKSEIRDSRWMSAEQEYIKSYDNVSQYDSFTQIYCAGFAEM